MYPSDPFYLSNPCSSCWSSCSPLWCAGLHEKAPYVKIECASRSRGESLSMSLAVVRGFGFSLSLILLVSCGAAAQRSYDDNSNTQQAAANANITQGPVIQYADDQFAVITWTTDQPFVSRVFYGKDASNLNQISEDVRSQSLRHQINLRNLQPSTTYYFRIDTGQGTAAAASTDSLNGFQTTALGANPIRNQQPFKGAVQNAASAGSSDSTKTANFGAISLTRDPAIQ